MVTVNQQTKNIAYSVGDEFYLEATIKNYTPRTGDVFKLSVRDLANTTPSITLTATTETTTEGYIKCIFSSGSLNLAVGDYVYDICAQATNRKTFMFVAQFSVRVVAHSV